MKTMCPPGYHHNGFVATHALGAHLVLIHIHIHTYTDTLEQDELLHSSMENVF